MRLTDIVRRQAQKKGADLFGVASAAAFDHLEPDPERRASFFLKDARCVAVMGLKIVDAVMDPLKGEKDPYSENFRGYLMNYNYNLLDYICVQTARYLEDLGWNAYPVQARVTNREKDSGVFSHKTAAVLAGLGSVGKSSLVITPKYGPRVRLVSLITDAPLECSEDEIAAPGQVCGSCRTCLDACPAGAISYCDETRTVNVDKAKCREVMNDRQCALCQAICPFGRRGVTNHRRPMNLPV